MNHTLTPKPSILIVVSSVIVFITSLLLVAISISMFAAIWNPCSLISGVILLPLPLVLALQQYRGTFQAKKTAALSSAKLLFIVGGIACFSFVMSLGNMLFEQVRLPWFSFLIPLVIVGAFSFFTGWINLLWWRQLQSVSSSELHTARAPRFLLREFVFGFMAITAVIVLVIYFVQSTPPQYAENVSRDKSPVRLPAGASDISFCQGGRGTIACEFTIDETAFIKWVDSGIGSLESEAANISLKPITTPYGIRRYYSLTSELTGLDFITISNGLYYDWSKEDRGVFAVFDRTKKRGYYYVHFH